MSILSYLGGWLDKQDATGMSTPTQQLFQDPKISIPAPFLAVQDEGRHKMIKRRGFWAPIPSNDFFATIFPNIEPDIEPNIEPIIEPNIEPDIEPDIEPQYWIQYWTQILNPILNPVLNPNIEPNIEPNI